MPTRIVKMDELLVQVDLYADGVFDGPDPEVATVKPEGSAWICSDTLADLVRLTPG